MAKIRVHELAKEFGIPSKEMADRIRELGYPIVNYMSTLEDYEAQEVRKRLQKEGETPLEAGDNGAKAAEGARKTVVRRRHTVVRLKKVVKLKKVKRPEEGIEEKKEAAEKPSASPEGTAAPSPLEKEISEEKAVEKTGVSPAAEEEKVAEKQAQPEKEIESAEPSESAEAKREEAEERPAVQPQADTQQGKTPKQFVKILDRPRIEIPKKEATKKAAPQRRKRSASQQEARPGALSVPQPKAAAPPAAEKKPKKKGKRVVQASEIRGPARRKKPQPKKKERQKPITKLLAEEIDVNQPEELEIQAPLATAGKKKKKGKEQPEVAKAPTAPPKAGKRKFAIYETIQVSDLAKRMGVKVADVIVKLMGLGVMATANQALDYDTAALVASEFGYEVEKKAVAEDLIKIEEEAGSGELEQRPPVVTVMGHVDHGKTSLLDAIRQSDVAAKEAGGITQHIGAYQVQLPSGNVVTFLDTPGHEAFTAMRSRGAQVTDIVILVVAADDGVMAQTREAIDHARAAGVPIIVAINKIDKPGANPDRVKQELAELDLIPEDWGGDTIFVNVSAKKKIGIDELMEMLWLQAEILELKADANRLARGHVIESRLDKGRGPVATILVSEGTLHVGDAIVCGMHYGKVRAMINDKGQRVDSAGPSTPVEVQGLSGLPEAGNEFVVLKDEKQAREVAEYRQRKAREAELAKASKVSLESIFEKLQEAEVKELNLLIKADVQGSLEALSDALTKLSTKDVRVNIVRGSIGAITESDVLLASASNAIIIGFNVRPTSSAKALAEQEYVDIRYYDVIYNAIDEVKAAMIGMLEPEYREKVLGKAEVRQTFRVSKVGTVAGCYVLEGTIPRNANARLLRDNVVIYTGKITSLKRFKEDAREVQAGYECGIGLEKFNDIKVGDIIEAFEMEEIKPELGKSLEEQDQQEKQ